MNRVWVTRTQPGAGETAARLTEAGYRPVIAPLLSVGPPDEMPVIPESDALLIFTSRNGVGAFSNLTDRRHWDVVTVGDATAELAAQAGFVSVTSVSGTSSDIKNYVIGNIPRSRPVVHVSGAVTRGEIVEALMAEGFQAQKSVVYQTHAAGSLPPIDVAAIDAVLVHSPLASKTLATLAPDLSNCVSVSISKAADQALGTLRFRERRVAKSPDERALLAALRA